MTIADQLRAAADVLRRDGWTQHCFHDENGHHCTLGALARVYHEHSLDKDDATLCHVLAEALGLRNLNGIPPWNDDPTNTASNVITALEFAALWWEQAQAQTAQAEQVEMS